MAKKKRSALSQAAALIGRKGGRAKTKAKAVAVRANGRKGGRPRKSRLRAPWVAQGWPAEPLRPWTVLIVARTLMEKSVIEADGFERAIFPDCGELARRLDLPVVAYLSTSGTPPYTRHGHGQRPGVPPADDDYVRDALTETRALFGRRPPSNVRDAATLRAWSVAQLQALRMLIDDGESALAADEWPWDTAARLAEAATAYADALMMVDDDDDDKLDVSGFKFAMSAAVSEVDDRRE